LKKRLALDCESEARRGQHLAQRIQMGAFRRDAALSGAAGILFGAFIYLIAARIGEMLGPLMPFRDAAFVLFLLLFAISVVEMPVMLFGLRHMRAAKMNNALIHGLNTIFVAFAAVYAGIQVILFGESNLSLLLVGLSLARWAAGSWIA
jgi:hypothetical protein